MSRSARMATEVSHVAAKITRAIDCATCGTGIAIDMVGERWGEPPYDWKGERFGHACAVTRGGLTPDHLRDIEAIKQNLETWSHGQRGGDYQAPLVDPRLPPEHEDPETNA